MSTHADPVRSPGHEPRTSVHAIVVAERWDSLTLVDEAVGEWIDVHGVEVVTVLSPPVVGRVAWLTGDTQDQQHEATATLDAACESLRARGLLAIAGRADDDPVASVSAAMEDRAADHVLLVRHSDDRGAWRQVDLRDRIAQELGVTVDEIEVRSSVDPDAPGGFIDDLEGPLPEPNEPA